MVKGTIGVLAAFDARTGGVFHSLVSVGWILGPAGALADRWTLLEAQVPILALSFGLWGLAAGNRGPEVSQDAPALSR